MAATALTHHSNGWSLKKYLTCSFKNNLKRFFFFFAKAKEILFSTAATNERFYEFLGCPGPRSAVDRNGCILQGVSFSSLQAHTPPKKASQWWHVPLFCVWQIYHEVLVKITKIARTYEVRVMLSPHSSPVNVPGQAFNLPGQNLLLSFKKLH